MWQNHVKKTRMAHPGMSFKDALKEASKTYKRQPKKKGSGQSGTGLIHAKIAEAVYKNPNDRTAIDKYKYMGGDDERAIFESPSEIILGLRGTSNRSDVATDAALAIGRLTSTKRYKRDKRFLKNLIKKNTKKIILAGHSLAGSIVSELSREFNLEVWAYNAGFGPREAARAKIDKVACIIKKKGKRCKKTKLINHERTIGDPVSILGKSHPGIKTIMPKILNTHSISNWTT